MVLLESSERCSAAVQVPTSPLTVHATVATAQPDAAAFSGRDAKAEMMRPERWLGIETKTVESCGIYLYFSMFVAILTI